MNIMQVILAVLLVCLKQVSDVAGAPPPCELELFDAQVQQLLAEQMLSPEQTQQVLRNFTHFQDTLRSRWKGADLFVYGSLPMGIAAKTSDVDSYLRIPNHETYAPKYVVEEAAKLLHKYPDKYSHIYPKINATVPMIKFYDIALQRYIDISFRNIMGVVNSDLIAYYLNLDKRYTPLAAIIKLWVKTHRLTGDGLPANYVVYLMIVFYLQQMRMVPSGFELQAHLSTPRMIDNWNFNFEKVSYTTNNDISLYELLGGFFKYYSEFDFENNCVSPFAGRPIAKSDFADIKSIPKEFSLLKKKIVNGDVMNITLHTDICVQGPFDHNKNAAKQVKSKKPVRFIVRHLKSAAILYDHLPCTQFLRTILKMNGNETSLTNVECLRHVDL